AFTRETTMVGTANADLWVRTEVDDVPLSVTLSEVRADGDETYVQSGWMLAQHRKLAAGSTELDPQHTGYESDAEPMPHGEWQRIEIEVFPFAHVFRPGSRLRLSVHTPGGDRPRWAWILPEYDLPPVIEIAHHADHPSRLVLPVVAPLASYPSDPPPCPSLRGQPCRAFEPYENRRVDG
ncbi:MAG TPA: CocE/NonD family hydrolase C-terminal non-catalytic domain-containing protein, partial [Microthrixaceae bacterium]|nr:CocE/NonD family hydrolase C-terminal non-catalytic domain-containing protein [Microthrixaceae bacterium]